MFRKEKQNTTSIQDSKLIDALNRRLNGEQVDLTGNAELESSIRKIEDMIKESNKKRHDALKEINQLSQYMMKMDFVNEMIVMLNQQLSSVEMVAATSEEMSASIMTIAEHVSENTNSANKSVEVSEIGAEELKDAVASIEDAFSLTSEAKVKVEDVTQQATKINEMVGIIESVANQTNLLALNASIEAARAGEAGRGFAVVADEIKKLAESTKESVKLIQDVVNDLNSSIHDSVDAIEQATVSFKSGVSNINKASTSVERSKDEIGLILKGLTAVSGQIESQTASTQEVTANIQDINEKTKELYSQTNQTGHAFSDIANEVDSVRQKLLADDDTISETNLIDMAITDHLRWRWRIYNMIIGYETIHEHEVGDHHQCRLGKWIEGSASKNPAFANSLRKLEKPHSDIHSLAKRAVTTYNSGDTNGAKATLDEIDRVSGIIIEELNALMAASLDSRDTSRSAALFEWSQKLTVYNKSIDEQHKKLLQLGRKLEHFYNNKTKSRDEFIRLVNELKEYTVYHFSYEEDLMEQAKYTNLAQHKEIHKSFVSKVQDVDPKTFNIDSTEDLRNLILFLSKWVIQHIRNEDFKYSSYLSDH